MTLEAIQRMAETINLRIFQQPRGYAVVTPRGEVAFHFQSLELMAKAIESGYIDQCNRTGEPIDTSKFEA